ncbi:MAG: hypothetical protein HY706_10590 [Candidatus Hydrogenedentes bacterium]|nr:hypothetical protein [Candidatus Hydrogenedentota bacterium]
MTATLMLAWTSAGTRAAAADTAAQGAGTAMTLYVSKLGDNSDGTSWGRAFHTIQAALSAIPDDRGRHRIIIRPDTYFEANLFPKYPGAPGAYNVLEADWDGSLGSGVTGWAVVDSSDPDKGFKSVDWYGPFRADPEFSAIGWDRWVLRRMYTTGGDAGLFWDLTNKLGSEFTVVVEDSVGIGRAFGGGVGAFVGREKEPVVFRRCWLWCLDWWGDAAGAYVRAERESLPEFPDVVFEDCTLVGPDNAVQAGNPGYAGYTRLKLKNCKLAVFNFSQPRGTPSTGIICSTIEGKLLHVDLEDCTLMGYKVFGAGKGDVSYSTKGCVRAYVQYEQSLPEGFLRLGHWPQEIFQSLLPPTPGPCRPILEKGPVIRRDRCETSPMVWQDRVCLLESIRPGSGGSREEYYLIITDEESGQVLARFAEGHSLASALVHNGAVYAFASRFETEGGPWNDVTMFKSSDLKQWTPTIVIKQEGKEHLFNSSVCADDKGFVMAYESDDPAYPAFTIKFARSNDLETWTKLPDVFGHDRYTACPSIRYADGWYYVLYTEHRKPRWFFETFLARSRDLKTWELAPKNPVLTPEALDDGINTSDPDLIEFRGATRLYYSVGDQRTWMHLKRAAYLGPLAQFLAEYFQ